MIHTSHQHWNPEIHHAISTGNPPGISPPLLQPSWNYYWNCWRTQRWDPFWDLPWSHLLGPNGWIGQLGGPWKVGRGKLIWDSNWLPMCRISTLNPKKIKTVNMLKSTLMLGWVGKLYWLTKKTGGSMAMVDLTARLPLGPFAGLPKAASIQMIKFLCTGHLHSQEIPSPTKKYPNKPM